MNLRAVINEYFDQNLKKIKVYAQVGEVISIDNTERTCIIEPLNGDSERKIRIQASLNLATGLYIKPRLNSKVIFTFLNHETGVIISFSELDAVYLTCDTEIILNDGENGGMVKVSELVGKLNSIENDINNLKTGISAWTPVPNDGGSALKTALSTWSGSQLDVTIISDLENERVKQ